MSQNQSGISKLKPKLLNCHPEDAVDGRRDDDAQELHQDDRRVEQVHPLLEQDELVHVYH